MRTVKGWTDKDITRAYEMGLAIEKVKRKERSRVVERRRKQRMYERAVEYLGGACLCCGDLLERHNMAFHHVRDKEFTISQKLSSYSWEKIKAELNKCQLLCVICHKNLHAEQRKYREG